MRIVFLVFGLVLIIFFGTSLVERFSLEWKKYQVDDELKRLQRATMQAFHDKAAPTEAQFWKEIGRAEPMKDPWGNNYRLSHLGDDLVWLSSGPDKKMNTSDDFSKFVLVRDGVVLYLENKPSEPSTGTRVMDAK